MKRIAFILVGFVAILGGGCRDSEEEAIRAAILANMEATQAEDMEAVMATISRSVPTEKLEATHRMMDRIFETYDCSYALESCELVEVKGDRAQVRVKQVTRKLTGELPFRDNRLTALHALVKEDGVWKLADMKVEAIEYLN